MPKTLPVFFLYLLIVLEGYVVLSSELLAIRQTIPFVGSGTDTVSIIIAAVLMPLAFGYQSGGRFKPGFKKSGKYQSIRSKLIFNLLASMCILLIGLSYPLLNAFFVSLIETGITNRLALVTIYSALFLVIPVYLLGQTIPLVSNYFSKSKLAQTTGKILCYSTLGSFLGAVFSTLVLMSFIGVHNTVAINFVILASLIILLSKTKITERNIIVIAIAIGAIYLNSGTVLKGYNIVENNKYNTIAYYELEGYNNKTDKPETERHLILNNNASSMLSESGRKHKYIEFIERVAIDPIMLVDKPKDILVIGAGAFTLGVQDRFNNYDFLDIDKSLQSISEELILKAPIGDNKTFHPIPARAFLSQTDKKYDLIVLDAYLGALTLPEHLITKDFFEQVKGKLNNGGVVIGNFILSPNFDNKFTQNVDNTIRSVFTHISRHAIDERYSVWNKNPSLSTNVAYIYTHNPDIEGNDIYTDNKNRVFYDKPNKQTSHEEINGQ